MLDINGGAHLARYPDLPAPRTGVCMSDRALPSRPLRRPAAIVTGAASGIGAALVRALSAAGADRRVRRHRRGRCPPDCCRRRWRGAQPRRHRRGGGPGLVDAVVAEHGRLDLLFNNAGITLGGETETLSLAPVEPDHRRQPPRGRARRRRGVPADDHAGRGHIVNTASMGGLMAAGLLTSYVATKHAVVGLSLALRSEAAAKGVGVTVVCPSAVDTPILDKGEVGAVQRPRLLPQGPGHPPPARARPPRRRGPAPPSPPNKAMLVTPRASRIAWRLGRLSPTFVQASSIRFVARQRKLQQRRVRRGVTSSH